MLPELQNEQQILAIEAASVPHMKQDTRRSVFARLTKRRGGEVRARSLTQALTEAGVPVKTVPKAR
jgi:hypothetical protein